MLESSSAINNPLIMINTDLSSNAANIPYKEVQSQMSYKNPGTICIVSVNF